MQARTFFTVLVAEDVLDGPEEVVRFPEDAPVMPEADGDMVLAGRSEGNMEEVCVLWLGEARDAKEAAEAVDAVGEGGK